MEHGEFWSALAFEPPRQGKKSGVGKAVLKNLKIP
jgi:hypothetical protein